MATGAISPAELRSLLDPDCMYACPDVRERGELKPDQARALVDTGSRAAGARAALGHSR